MRQYRMYDCVDITRSISAEELYQSSNFTYDMKLSLIFEELKKYVLEQGLRNCKDFRLQLDHDREILVKHHFDLIVILKVLSQSALESGATSVTVHSSITGGELVISVIDNGEGILEKDIPYVFMPSSTNKQKGKIGLFNVKKTVIHSGGKFKLDSEPGKGTICTVYYPASEIIITDDLIEGMKKQKQRRA